jgi:hypothetical protein
MSLRFALAPLALVIATSIACGDAGAPASGSSKPAASGATAAPSGSAAAEPAIVTLDDAAVKKLVDEWLAAQNKGDFAGYQKLYAQKLEGIKRAGEKTWRFDKKGFLADRERMFKKPMTVEAKDVTVHASAVSAVVDFKQRFKQDKFEDEGPKRLVVVKEDGGLRIAREEMLHSVLASGGAAAARPFRFVLTVEGKPYVVIQQGDASWASGAAALPMTRRDKHPDFLAVRPAGKAPASAQAWKGRALDLYEASGRKCEATVKDLALIGGGTPHFGEVQAWDGAPENGKPTMPVLSPARRAEHVFGMGKPYLVASIDLPADCKPAFALEPKTPKLFKPIDLAADDAGARAAREAFKKLGAYQDAQKSFVTDFQGKGDWAKSIELQGFEDGSRRFIAVRARELTGCADFAANVSALFEVTTGSKVVLVAEGIGKPSAVFDSDGDGKIELLATVDGDDGVGMYRVVSGGEIVATEFLDFPYNDCPC